MVDISIITRGRNKLLKKCVNSILENTYSKFRIWIVADGDKEVLKLKDYWNKKFITIDYLEHSGLVYCNNWVVRNRVKSHWLQGLDDLIFYPEALQEAVNCLEEKYPEYDGVVGLNQFNIPQYQFSIPLVGKKFLERFPDKKPFYEKYYHFGADTELGLFAKSLDKFWFCKEAKVFHNHPAIERREEDETHKLARVNIQNDLKLLKKRKKNKNFWGRREDR